MVRTRANPALLKALARAFRWQKPLDEGRYASISEMAEAEKIERGFLGKMLQLTLLAPWLVEAIVDGRQGEGVSLPGLMEGVEAVWPPAANTALCSMCWSPPDPLGAGTNAAFFRFSRARKDYSMRACLARQSPPRGRSRRA